MYVCKSRTVDKYCLENSGSKTGEHKLNMNLLKNITNKRITLYLISKSVYTALHCHRDRPGSLFIWNEGSNLPL